MMIPMASRTFLGGLAFIACSLLPGLPAGAQDVSLVLRPRVGDTLRMAMDQEIEMSGTRRYGDVDTTRTVRSSIRVVTRSIVVSSDSAGTLFSALAESVTVNTTDLHGKNALDEARRRLLGRTVMLRMSPDGSTQLVAAEAGSDPSMGALFAQMPATLPRERVAVGESWWKEMTLPGGAASSGGVLRAKFKLDSLTSGGQLAWISITGNLEPSKGRVVQGMGGTVNGGIRLERKRGWLTDVTTVMTVRSVVNPPPGAQGEPMHFRIRVIQRLRALPR
jgi:hypothetical protein